MKIRFVYPTGACLSNEGALIGVVLSVGTQIKV